jgi:acid phosphatase
MKTGNYFYCLIALSAICYARQTPIPQNLTFAKQCITDYYTDGRYEKDVKKAASKAWNYLKKRTPAEKDIVIFDIDDTVLSTFKDAKKVDYSFIPKSKSDWIQQANAPAIQSIKDLYNQLKEKGFKIVFLTGRLEQFRKPTLKNLENEGFSGFEKLIMRSDEQEKMKAADYKINEHKKLTKEGYTIIACIGDQWSDLNGKTCGYTIKVPNYMYIIE